MHVHTLNLVVNDHVIFFSLDKIVHIYFVLIILAVL
jgi:hypothetical protein